MAGFLERIAKKMYSENGCDLRSHCLVFPNRRAGLFFMKYLAAEIDKPVWTPAVPRRIPTDWTLEIMTCQAMLSCPMTQRP